MAQEQFSFLPFTRHSFYTDLNSSLVEQAGFRPGQRVIDLACGTGAVSRLILDKIRGARDGLLLAIDGSSAALRQAREDLGKEWGSVRFTIVEFIQARAEHLPQMIRQRVDAVVLCNAIHMVPDKSQLVEAVRDVLIPGGIFAFNSAFFRGTNPPETDQFYRRWMARAVRILRGDYGLTPIKAEKVEARKHLSVEEYSELLQQNGFRIKEALVQHAPMPLQAWIDISSYEEFIAGVLPGVPLEQASAAMKKAVTQVFEELRLHVVPRNWLSMVAIRT